MKPKKFICWDKEFCRRPCVLTVYELSGIKLRSCPDDCEVVDWSPLTEEDERKLEVFENED